MSESSPAGDVLGAGPLGLEAESLQRATRGALPPSAKVADSLFLADDVRRSLASLDPSAASHAALETIAGRFGTNPLLLRPSPVEQAGPTASKPVIVCGGREANAAAAEAARSFPGPGGIVVQRLAGARRGKRFYPLLSGRGSSFNPYAWNEYIEPSAGVARLVVGLASRLDDASGEDFARVVPLDAPGRRPETDADGVARYAQRRVDTLSLETALPETIYFADLVEEAHDLPLPLLTSESGTPHPVTGAPVRVLTLDPLLKRGDLVPALKDLAAALKEAFAGEVEMELTADVSPDGPCRIELNRCLPTAGLPDERQPDETVLEGDGAVLGRSRVAPMDLLVYVRPGVYGSLPPGRRYEVARLIGRITRAAAGRRMMLLGPGRWATTSPELGVPVSFAEIRPAAALVEIAAMHETLAPEVSRGAHIFNELVATGMLYLAIFPGKPHNHLDEAFFDRAPNVLAQLVPGAEDGQGAVRVIDVRRADASFFVRADAIRQRATAGFGRRTERFDE